MEFGTIFEGSALRTVEELDAAIIEWAQFHGLRLDIDDADQAIDWLNLYVAEWNCEFVLDDGLVYRPMDEDDF